jgi:alpha-methylacyl-CoA racemase
VVQPAPAPRFSRTPGTVERGPAAPGQHTDEILAEAGLSPAEITALKDGGTVG